MTLYVFVYGSLRQGEINDLAQAAARRGCAAPVWIGKGHVAGRLYDLGDYPALVAGGAGRVRGDVYAVGEDLLAVMDEIEEYVPGADSMYLREPVEIEVDGRRLACQYYPVLPHKLDGAPTVAAEDWIEFRRARDGARGGRA